MRNLKVLAFIALVLVMVVTACGGGEAATPQPATDAPTTSETTSETQATSAPAVEAEPTGEVEPTSEPEPTQATEADLALDSVSSGLAQLTSYKGKLYMRFTGKDAEGQDVDNSWSMEEEFILEPRAQRIIWTGSESTGGQALTTTGFETITIGQTTYMISQDASGTETCMALSTEDATAPEQALSPDMWGSISDAEYVNTETVNGVRAKHYAWKEGSLLTFGFASGKGETWVAVDGGYVVKQRIEATGKGVFLAGTDQEGTTTWEWDLAEVNGSFEILPPEGCESAAADIPIMADATEKTTYGDMISYTSASAFADVVTFYKTEMPNAGWQPSGTPMETADFVMLEYTKDERTASLMISFDQDSQNTTVVVTVAKP